MLLAFIALIAVLNGIIGGIGGWFGHEELTFQLILGYVFQPLAWVLGVPWNEANLAGSFFCQKMVVNVFVVLCRLRRVSGRPVGKSAIGYHLCVVRIR